MDIYLSMYLSIYACTHTHTYNSIYYILYNLAVRKEENSAIWDNIDETWGYYAKWRSQTEKDKYCMISLKKTVWRFLKDLKTEIPLHSAIPLLSIYPKEYKSFYYKDTCTCMFIAALFTIAKTWNQPKCPSITDWIKKMWHIYTMGYYAAIKKNEFMSFAGT